MIRVTVTTPPELQTLIQRLSNAQGDQVGQEAAYQVAPAFTRGIIEQAGDQVGYGPTGFSRGWLAQQNGPGLAITNTIGVLARYIELPTRPHIIQARPGKMLAWMPGRGPFSAVAVKASTKAAQPWIFAKVVHHPGTAGWNIFQTYMLGNGSSLIFNALSTAAKTILGG